MSNEFKESESITKDLLDLYPEASNRLPDSTLPVSDEPVIIEEEDNPGESVVPISSETKHDNFRRICQPRVQKAGKAISLIGNCADTARYEYSQEDVEKMFNYLQKALDDARAKFESKTEADSFSF